MINALICDKPVNDARLRGALDRFPADATTGSPLSLSDNQHATISLHAG
jgi:hypothetical protein